MDEARYHWRRVPGTLTLALTNLIASLIIVFPGEFERSPLFEIPVGIAPTWVWGGTFLISALALGMSTLTRSWLHLNIGSAISLFIWTFLTTVIIIKLLAGATVVTPVAFALFFWIFAGQAAMLFAPLWANGRGLE